MHQWRVVFWITFGILIFSAFIYCIWASGETQPWNNPEKAKMIEDGSGNINQVAQNEQIQQSNNDNINK